MKRILYCMFCSDIQSSECFKSNRQGKYNEVHRDRLCYSRCLSEPSSNSSKELVDSTRLSLQTTYGERISLIENYSSVGLAWNTNSIYNMHISFSFREKS